MNIVNARFLGLILKTIGKTIAPPEKGGGPDAQFQAAHREILTKHALKQDINALVLLNRTEQAVLIREMLSLPKDIAELLRLLQAGNQKITPEVLKQLLESNSKEVISRLLKLIQQTPDNRQNHEQLKQLISLISQVVPARDSTPQEALAHLLVLYLPWLPLHERQKLEIAFEKWNSGSQENEKVAMVLYISTINLGRFKIIIFADKNKNIEILIQNTLEKEDKNSKKVKNLIENIRKNIHISVIRQKHFVTSGKKEVIVTQVNDISPEVLAAAQKITQIIFEADEELSSTNK